MTTQDDSFHNGYGSESAEGAGAPMQVSDLTRAELEHYIRRAHHMRAQTLARAGRRLARWFSAGCTAAKEPTDDYMQSLDLNGRLSSSH